ncbi:LAFE_0A02058g1_1 [Lachancea fermentati]|uniref:Origin recognition complex subunit 1 n=1 Tax=Lachancea fermentati TaxID=4955 RepID=A0A1G4M6S1_LACFM|nr:LAFE_0A02058g1_1 [Lachancea fermentati]
MAATLSDLQGWDVIRRDSEGRIISDDMFLRRSRRRVQKETGEREHIYLQRKSDGVEFGCGSTVIVEEKSINSFSLYMIHEIRLNTLNHVVELWAFSYLRWFEVNPREFYACLSPEIVDENSSDDFYIEKFNTECNRSEIYLTAELSEIKLKDFLGKANIIDQEQYQRNGKLEENTFVVRLACEPDGTAFANIDIHSYEKKVTSMYPKESETYLQGLTVAAQKSMKSVRRNVSKVGEEPKALKKDALPEETNIDRASSKSPLHDRTSSVIREDSLGEVSLDSNRTKAPDEKLPPAKGTVVTQSRPIDTIDREKIELNTVQTKDSVELNESQSSKNAGEYRSPSPIETTSDSEPSESDDEEFQDAADDIDYVEGAANSGLIDENSHADENVDDDSIEEGQGEEDEDEDEEDKEIELYRGSGKRTSSRPKGRTRKARKILDSTPATPKKQQTPITPATLIKKYTKKNVSRAKKAYTPFSRRFKRPQDIPDLTKLAEFNQDRINMDIAAIENKLRSPKKQQTVETIFSRVKQQLYTSHGKDEIVRAGNFDDYLPARENEFASIYLSLYSAIEAGSGTTLYIAGTPGVGKTLTVREVVKELLQSAEQNELPNFQYVEINGLKMIKPSDSYEVLWNKISGERLTSGAAMESLEFYFNKVPKMKKRPILVLLDELDALVTKSQDVMYNFFNWTTYPNAKLIVIAVANTMDLPERQLGNKVSSRIGFTRIMFTGYNHDELKTIINLRLKGLNNSFFFVDVKNGSAHMIMDDGDEHNIDTSGMKKVRLKISEDAIEIASRKIASVSGDARRALKACKRAVEIAEHDYMKTHGYHYDGQASKDAEKGDQNDEEETQTVEISHIMKALNETVNSPTSIFLKSLSFTGKLFLYALLNLVRKTGVQEQSLGDVVDEIKSSIDANGKNKYVVAMHEVLFTGGSDLTAEQLRIISWDYVINQLIEAGIIIKQNLKNERVSAVKFSVSTEDVRRAIEQDKVLKTL